MNTEICVNLLKKNSLPRKNTGNIFEERDYEKYIEWYNKNITKEYSDKYDLRKGDTIIVRAGYKSNIEYLVRINGFDNLDNCYLEWDCYWFPKDLSKDMIKSKINI